MTNVLSLRSLVQSLSRKTRRGRKPVKSSLTGRFTPRMEALEDLTLPSTVFWTNPAGGNWMTPGNWSTGQVPGAADDAVIDMPGITVTHSQGADTIRSLTSRANFALTGGTLQLNTASVVDGVFTFTGGTLRGAGDLTLHGLLRWAGGMMEGAGQTNANGGIDFYAAFNNGLDGRVLNNTGTATWSGRGTLEMRNGSVFNNRAGATFVVSNQATFRLDTWEQVVSTFNNQGTFRMDYAGTTLFATNFAQRGVAFNNTGRLAIDAGELNLGGGGLNGSVIDVAANARVNLAAGAYQYNAGAQVTGLGRISVWGLSELQLNADVVVGNVELASGRIGGPGTLRVLNTLTWTGGEFSGGWGRVEVAAGGRLDISGTARKYLKEYRLVNAGTGVWTGTGNLAFGADAFLDNQGVFGIQNDAPITVDTTGTTFRNLGRVYKNTATGMTRIDAAFQNRGLVEVQLGALRIVDGDSTGSFIVDGLLEFAPATYTAHFLRESSVILGTGVVAFTSGSVDVAGSYLGLGTLRIDDGVVVFHRSLTVRGVSMSGGFVDLKGHLVINGMFNWTGGDMKAAGQVQANGGIQFGGYDTVTFRDGVLVNGATATWTSGVIQFVNNAVFVNRAGATFDAQVDSQFSFTGSQGEFQNHGTFRKTAGNVYMTAINGPLHNYGTVEVQIGWLGIFGWSDQTGVINVPAGTGLLVDSLIFAPTAQLTGAGEVWLYGLANYVTGDYNFAGDTYNLGSLTVAGDMRTRLMTNTGVVFIDYTGTLTASAGYEQYQQGLTYLGGGTLTTPGTVNISSGLLVGWGTINGNLLNAGRMIVGDLGYTGTLIVNGNFTQTSTGILDLEIGGTREGTEYDQLRISGRATLDGTLNLVLLNGYRSGVGDCFNILTYGTGTNEFALINGLDLGGGMRFRPVYGATGLVLETMRV